MLVILTQRRKDAEMNKSYNPSNDFESKTKTILLGYKTKYF